MRTKKIKAETIGDIENNNFSEVGSMETSMWYVQGRMKENNRESVSEDN